MIDTENLKSTQKVNPILLFQNSVYLNFLAGYLFCQKVYKSGFQLLNSRLPFDLVKGTQSFTNKDFIVLFNK